MRTLSTPAGAGGWVEGTWTQALVPVRKQKVAFAVGRMQRGLTLCFQTGTCNSLVILLFGWGQTPGWHGKKITGSEGHRFLV